MLARNSHKPILKVVLASLFFGHLFSRALIVSDPANQTSSFNFPVETYDFYANDGFYYFGAATAVSGNAFAVSAFKRGINIFSALAPEKTILNNIANQNNPLYGSKINFLSLMVDMPVLIKDGDNKKVYFMRSLDPKNMVVVNSQDVNDSSGTPTGGIVGLATNQPGTVTSADISKQLIFAAVQDSSGTFGVNNSGIALLQLVQTMSANTKNFALNAIDVQSGNGAENKALQLNISTPELVVTDTLSLITSTTVEMLFDVDTQKLYIGIQGQAGAGASDGIRGVVMAYIEGNSNSTKLKFQKIIPDNALNVPTQNNIIAAVGALEQVSIWKLRMMKTSTGVKYLIVVGGNGSGSTTKNQVYAIPIVTLTSAGNSNLLGTVASKNTPPLNGFSGRDPDRLLARGFNIPATSNSDLVTSSDVQALVGAASMVADITDINVVGDTVYVSTSQAGGGQQSGIFYSQAIFNPNGSIANWTSWKRTGGSAKNVFGLQFDVFLSSITYIQSADNQIANATQQLGALDYQALKI